MFVMSGKILEDGRSQHLFASQWGKTALFEASWSGNIEVVRELLDRGANLHHTNKVCRFCVCHCFIAIICVKSKNLVQGISVVGNHCFDHIHTSPLTFSTGWQDCFGRGTKLGSHQSIRNVVSVAHQGVTICVAL